MTDYIRGALKLEVLNLHSFRFWVGTPTAIYMVAERARRQAGTLQRPCRHRAGTVTSDLMDRNGRSDCCKVEGTTVQSQFSAKSFLY